MSGQHEFRFEIAKYDFKPKFYSTLYNYIVLLYYSDFEIAEFSQYQCVTDLGASLYGSRNIVK